MLALKRLFLVIFVLGGPLAISAALYFGSLALLQATNRVIDPEIMQAVAVGGFAVFFLLAVYEAKARWS
ncbi:MAG: hypothetical protein ACTHLR_05185 [Rhizomicrobium sp.]